MLVSVPQRPRQQSRRHSPRRSTFLPDCIPDRCEFESMSGERRPFPRNEFNIIWIMRSSRRDRIRAGRMCISTDDPHFDSNFPNVSNNLLANVSRETAVRIRMGGPACTASTGSVSRERSGRSARFSRPPQIERQPPRSARAGPVARRHGFGSRSGERPPHAPAGSGTPSASDPRPGSVQPPFCGSVRGSIDESALYTPAPAIAPVIGARM